MLTDFQNSFTDRLISKFATKSSLTIPTHLKCVTTLPCEISVFKKFPCSRSESMKQAVIQNSAIQYTDWPYQIPTVWQYASAATQKKRYRSKILLHYDKWSVSYFLPVTSSNVHRF